jgi:anti-sigma regulatory factor (Ser/Thr protein kinase)
MGAARTLRVVGTPEGIRKAAEDFDRFSDAHALSSKARWPFQVALDEMLSNIVEHGYHGAHGREIEVRFALGDGVLQVTIEDDAAPFDPLQAPEPATGRPLEEREVGGLGISLVRKLMEAVEYERAGGRNRVVLRRKV